MSKPSSLRPAQHLLPALLLAPLAVQAQQAPGTEETLEAVAIIGQATTYSKATVSEQALDRVPLLGSVNDALNELPGVVVSESDAFGSAVWGTQINMRGFVTGRDTQQIGTTIDGLPNGGSSYGGGSLANRYIDTLDLRTVEVSQGTADISSRSNEALGGTLNFLTSDPADEQGLKLVFGGGDYNAKKYYARYDTGTLFGNTRAWVSGSLARNDDWIDGSGHTSRDHLSAKFVTDLDSWTLSGFFSYDDANEPEYASVTPEQFRRDPEHDLLTGELTGIPYLDQNFRSGSRALRENTFGYLRAAFEGGNGFRGTLTGYAHAMEGRGDWIPQYLVDVTNDGTGNANSELGGSTVLGGSQLGTIAFITPGGATATPIAGCASPQGLPAEYNPACYPAGSVPVQSYRHTHYDNDRIGFTGDIDWNRQLGTVDNTVRAGLWLEKFDRTQRRDWHRLTNVGVNIAFDHTPYWVQYEDDFGADTTMAYIEDVADFGAIKGRIGVKQFWIDQDRTRTIGASEHVESDSRSDPLLSVGLTWTLPVDGVEAFAGFSQNYAAIRSGILGGTNQLELNEVEPETADNIELGLRVARGPFNATATLYQIKFDNRIVYLPSNFVDGIDYLGEVDGVYENFGGVKSKGLEAAFGYRLGGGWLLNAAYTLNKAEYVGSGDAARDAELGLIPGEQVIGQPRHTLVVSADYRGELWNFGLSGRMLGKRPLDASGTSNLPSSTVYNANVGFNLGSFSEKLKGIGADLVISNLTDKRYLSGVDGSGAAFIGAPRTVVFSVSAQL